MEKLIENKYICLHFVCYKQLAFFSITCQWTSCVSVLVHPVRYSTDVLVLLQWTPMHYVGLLVVLHRSIAIVPADATTWEHVVKEPIRNRKYAFSLFWSFKREGTLNNCLQEGSKCEAMPLALHTHTLHSASARAFNAFCCSCWPNKVFLHVNLLFSVFSLFICLFPLHFIFGLFSNTEIKL